MVFAMVDLLLDLNCCKMVGETAERCCVLLIRSGCGYACTRHPPPFQRGTHTHRANKRTEPGHAAHGGCRVVTALAPPLDGCPQSGPGHCLGQWPAQSLRDGSVRVCGLASWMATWEDTLRPSFFFAQQRPAHRERWSPPFARGDHPCPTRRSRALRQRWLSQGKCARKTPESHQ
jgi:hypothetical protein